MAVCKHEHRNDPRFHELPEDQGRTGRHRCAGCAYDMGFAAGKIREESPRLDFTGLPESQAKAVRACRSRNPTWSNGRLRHSSSR